jgi:hypothetical protein
VHVNNSHLLLELQNSYLGGETRGCLEHRLRYGSRLYTQRSCERGAWVEITPVRYLNLMSMAIILSGNKCTVVRIEATAVFASSVLIVCLNCQRPQRLSVSRVLPYDFEGLAKSS